MVFSSSLGKILSLNMKNEMRLKYFVIIISLSVFAQVNKLDAQILVDSIVYKPEVEKEFVEAMRFFRAGEFDSASASFLNSIKTYPRSHRTTGAYIMGAKALFELKNYKESIRLLKDLIDLYPQSEYLDDAHYSLGLDFYRSGRYEDAAMEFIIVNQSSKEPRLTSKSEEQLNVLTTTYLTLAELQRLKPEAKSDNMKALMTVRVAEKILRTGDLVTAEQMLRSVAGMPPSVKYVDNALSLLEQMAKRGGVKIGVVLPLMLKMENPASRVLGVEFLQGIQLAVDEYNQTVPLKIGMEVRDSERDPSVAARQVSELCSDEKISVIIGPILSNEVFASAGIANERGVPLITPTATANGIASIGPFVFQANPDFDMRGRDAAAYAYTALNAKRFAVLAPKDAVGRQMAESFIAEVASLGGEVIDAQFYTSGSSDLRTELMAIRRKALEKLEIPVIDFGGKIRQSELNKLVRWGVNSKTLDSLVERGLTSTVTTLFGDRGAVIADSLGLPTRLDHLKYDSLGLPVPNIDVIFVPIASSDEIPVVSSQIKFFNLQTQIVGTADWNDAAVLDQNRQYTDGIIFTADTYSEPNSESYRSFNARYLLANSNKAPGNNAMFGYDVAKMVVQIIAQGKIKRTEVANALVKVEGFEGLHSKISLSSNRVNSYLSVLQYKGHQIKRIGEIDLTRLGK
jgi:ABC-type branched-subunit amino acid transport system substrate-binding protein